MAVDIRFDNGLPALRQAIKIESTVKSRRAQDQSENTRDVPTVSQLTAEIKESLASDFSKIWVRGEISDLTRAGSGHLYFSLKDSSARLSCVIWQSTARRIRDPLQEGQEIVCQGSIDVYPPRGAYQLIVSNVAPVGVGALQLAFQQLHTKLKTRGWFDPQRKRHLPGFPRRIGLVTSSEGAAVRDFLEVLGRRWPVAEVLLSPTRVQGDGSAQEIAKAIRLAGRVRPVLDVLAVCRGGGSAEDLWSFNEEIVCQAIVESPIPVVTGIGHEIDVTLSDLCADVRALTPTEAAERIAPHRAEWLNQLRDIRARVSALVAQRVNRAQLQLDAVAARAALSRPLDRIHHWGMRLDESAMKLRHAIHQQLERSKRDFQVLASRLESLNPLGVLARGYSVTRSDAHPVLNDVKQVNVGELVTTRLATGLFTSRVEEIFNYPETADDEPQKERTNAG